jgi:hypothetical protein
MSFAQAKGPQYEAWLWDRLWYLHTWADRGEMTPAERPAVTAASFNAVNPTPLPPSWHNLVNGKVTVQLMNDFAAASFYWHAVRGDEIWMNGGLIYHGCQKGWRADDVYSDPLSVQLVATRNGDNPWSVHT